MVARALSFHSGTSPGPTGLRAQHLLDAVLPGHLDSFHHTLAQVTTLLARGQACAAVAPVVAGAGLVAVPKPNGGVRPIAIGEIYRRLTAKCLLEEIRPDARRHFWPVQTGVCVPAGVDAAVHTVRAWANRNNNCQQKVLVKLDFHNAFNTISRKAVLDAVETDFPTLSRWAWWCYGQPSGLRFGGATLASAGGVQQGDPLGPLLFAAAIHSLAQDLRRGLDIGMFYLDDGVLAGDVAAVSAALLHQQQRAAALGLTLNLRKSEVIAMAGAPATVLQRYFPPELLQDHSGCTRVAKHFELLGAPVGDDAFCAQHTASRVKGASQLLDAVADIDDLQIGLRLLRTAAGHSKLLHSLRCAPPGPQQEALRHFDVQVRSCFQAFAGLHPEPQQWEQASRSPGFGGLGLRSAAEDSAAAWLHLEAARQRA